MTEYMNLLIMDIIKCFNVFLDCRASLAMTDEKILLPFMRSLSVIPAQAGIQAILSCFAKSKDFATIFLDQARKRQRTCHAGCIVPAGYPRIFNFTRALRDSVVASNNFKQVLTLYPCKIKNTSATQMRGFKDYYFISLLRRFATRNDKIQDGFPPARE
jgi:hypothetical protein